MSYSIRATTPGDVVRPSLTCSSVVWAAGMNELCRRGVGMRESGAFLVGQRNADVRRIEGFVFYDDLDPGCLASGIIVFDGAGYGPLWELCRARRCEVVADVHTHEGRARQSEIDSRNPMVAQAGHVALIVPSFAQHATGPRHLGIYEYLGSYAWRSFLGRRAAEFFRIEKEA